MRPGIVGIVAGEWTASTAAVQAGTELNPARHSSACQRRRHSSPGKRISVMPDMRNVEVVSCLQKHARWHK